MKKYKYHCDGGALCLGNECFTCHYMNQYGDGAHNLYIKTRQEKWPELPYDVSFYNMYHFEGTIEGQFNIYKYDCLTTRKKINKDNILCTLSGRYGIYSVKNCGDMIIECWEAYTN